MSHLSRATEILTNLIAFPTVSSDSNLALIDYAAELLSGHSARLQVTKDGSGAKANLFASIGPDVDGGIVLSGHTDVVPVVGQEWTTDPFQLRQQDGLIFGRGACDMKGFIACALAMAPGFAAAELKKPIHFALTYDEETGCLGAPVMLAGLEESGIRPAVAIIGEPTEMRIIEGHKGCYEYTTEFTGLEGHGSLPDQAVNAVEYATRYISRLMELREDVKSTAPEGSRFDPPWTTLQIGRIAGGIAHNIIAKQCTVDWEMRPVQAADATYIKSEIADHVNDVLLPAMRAIYENADITTQVIGEVEGLEPVEGSQAYRIVSELTGRNTADVVSFGTEAGLFQNAGISTVVCGPGSIEQAHKPDEFVALDQLQACLDMQEKLLVKLTG